MKIIHTSDIHIDSPLTSRLPVDKVRERRRELLNNFTRLISRARSEGAAAIIIAGDLFDSKRISKKALEVALEAIEEALDITFFYLPGNHEGDAVLSSGKALPRNLLLFGNEWTYFNFGDTTIAGRSEICQGLFDSLSLPRDTKNIVVLHGELADRTSAPESIGIKDAADKNIDYMALGHYHSYSRTAIDHRGAAVYCGTPEGRGFDEAGEKGFVLMNVTSKGVESGFVPFAKRKLHIIPVDISGATRVGDLNDRVRRAIAIIPREDMVRVELCGKYAPDLWKDTDTLEKEHGGLFYYFEIKDSSRIAINPEDYKYDRSLKGEFIRTVSADESLDERMKERIIQCGLNALMGEDLFDI